MKQNKLSAIVPTFNEEANLPDCLNSLQWVDEILVVDSFSDDNTVEIAQKYGARVLQNEYNSHASQRNWAINQAVYEWILLLDADERVTPELQTEIQNLLNNNPVHDAYWIRRRNFYLGYEIKYSGWGNDYLGRLFKKSKGKIEEWGFHGELVSDKNNGKLKHAFLHYSYKNSDEIFDKIKVYAKGGAEQMKNIGKKSSYIQIVSRPLWAFCYNYFFRWGFLDGIPGLMVCTQTAYYVFMKYAILWKLNQQN